MSLESSASSGTAAIEGRRGGASPESAIGPWFVLRALLLSVLFFGALRLGWVERYILVPFTGFQEFLACRIGGDPNSPVRVTLSCSGADVIALCLGFVLAFPVRWRDRIRGAFIGLLLIAAINTVRIAILTRVARTAWFQPLHIYILPGILLLVVAVYVFFWMSSAAGGAREGERRGLLERLGATSPTVRRFAGLTFLFVLLFFVSGSWWMESPAIKEVASWIAATGGAVIQFFGGEATVKGNVLRTANGGYFVTQECIISPLIPVYFAAVLALPMAPTRRLVALLASIPLFYALGTARLLILAVPRKVVGSHQFAIHGFHQLVAGLLLVGLAAFLWNRSRGRAGSSFWARATGAIAAGAAGGVLAARFFVPFLLGTVEALRAATGHAGHGYLDNQGAILLMPPYQLGLFVALWIALGARPAWRRLALSLVVLFVSQVAVIWILGEAATHLDLRMHAALVRAWAVLLPAALAWYTAGAPRFRLLSRSPASLPDRA